MKSEEAKRLKEQEYDRGSTGWVALDPTGAAQPEEVLPRENSPREPPVPRHTGRLQSEPTRATLLANRDRLSYHMDQKKGGRPTPFFLTPFFLLSLVFSGVCLTRACHPTRV